MPGRWQLDHSLTEFKTNCKPSGHHDDPLPTAPHLIRKLMTTPLWGWGDGGAGEGGREGGRPAPWPARLRWELSQGGRPPEGERRREWGRLRE